MASRVAPGRNRGQRRRAPAYPAEPAAPASQRTSPQGFAYAVADATAAEDARRFRTGDRVVRDETMRGTVLQVAEAMALAADFDGRDCRPSVAWLMGVTQLSERTVRYARAVLRRHGFIAEQWRGTRLPGRAGGIRVASVYELRTPIEAAQLAEEAAIAAHPARVSARGAARRVRRLRRVYGGLSGYHAGELARAASPRQALAAAAAGESDPASVDGWCTPPVSRVEREKKDPLRAEGEANPTASPPTGAADAAKTAPETRSPWLVVRRERHERRRRVAQGLRAAFPGRLGCLSVSWLASAAYGVGWLVDLGWTVDDFALWFDRWRWPLAYNPRSLVRWRLDQAREHAAAGLARPTDERALLHREEVAAHAALVDELTDPSRVAINELPPASVARSAWVEMRANFRARKAAGQRRPAATTTTDDCQLCGRQQIDDGPDLCGKCHRATLSRKDRQCPQQKRSTGT